MKSSDMECWTVATMQVSSRHEEEVWVQISRSILELSRTESMMDCVCRPWCELCDVPRSSRTNDMNGSPGHACRGTDGLSLESAAAIPGQKWLWDAMWGPTKLQEIVLSGGGGGTRAVAASSRVYCTRIMLPNAGTWWGTRNEMVKFERQVVVDFKHVVQDTKKKTKFHLLFAACYPRIQAPSPHHATRKQFTLSCVGWGFRGFFLGA